MRPELYGRLFVCDRRVTAQTPGNGIISGYKIDHNTGNLVPIAGLPISSGGANPGRAVLLNGGRFIYVLNQGVNAEGGTACTSADPCTKSNITQFSIGGNGVLAPQQTFFTQGLNPFRIFTDTAGNYLYVLDHDSPATISTPADPVSSSSTNPNPSCGLTLGTGVVSCGDITVFQINADHRSSHSGGKLAGHFRYWLRAPLLPGSGQIPSILCCPQALCSR